MVKRRLVRFHPDECDIAAETSVDVDENGVPDECDILMEECADANEDDCCDEAESLLGGGGTASSSGTNGSESSTGETPVPQSSTESESSQSQSSENQSPCAELTEAECRAAFHDWAMQQCWGPQCESTGLEQYHAAKEKLAELGLP